MFRGFVLSTLIIMASMVTGSAADLYEVAVPSKAAADQLRTLDVDAVVKTNDGYLVLADEAAGRDLLESGLDVSKIASNISRDEIALDARLDKANVDRYPLLFEDGELRVYRADYYALSRSREQVDLAPIPSFSLPILFKETRTFDKSRLMAGVDLDSLIGLVSQDTIIAYTERLQAYLERVTGSDSCHAAADWTIAKFQQFGYDSTYYDEFTTTIYGVPKLVQNTVAVKLGTKYPERYIVVGGHRDAVPGSPGADDNGTGTVGTLEIARVLAGIETELTFIFITFSGEEQGLLGAYNYADAAAARDDTILYMFNMDMIAHFENETEAKVYHGTDATYSQLWIDLADSLVGLAGYLMGNTSGSDHYPFTVNGYQSSFLHENIFSSVYHTYQDSTTYLNYDYMTKMIKAGLATVYAANLDQTAPRLEFVYPAGMPGFIEPGIPTTLEVELVPVNEAVLIPGTAMIHHRIDGGEYQDEEMILLSGDTYQADLPAVECNNTLEFYFSAEEASAGMFYDPSPTSPYSPTVATEITYVVADSFETDLGWTTQIIGATSGQWERGVPVGGSGWDYDPDSDADGSGQCYVTQNIDENSDVDDGAVRLISPLVDFSSGGLVSYEYFLRLNNAAGGVDRLLVEVNGEGGVGLWTEIARHDTDGGLDWRHHEITSEEIQNAGVTLTSSMKFRFTANDADPQSVVEAGVDGFHVVTSDCDTGEYLCGDADGSGAVDIDDAVYLINHIFSGWPPPDPLAAGDADCSGAIDIDDAVYVINFIFSGGPPPCDADNNGEPDC